MDYEYARFGNGFLRRKLGSTDDWQGCAERDVSPAFFYEEGQRRHRLRNGVAPRDLEPGEVRLASGAIRKPNPAVDAIGEELGLSPEEIRTRLNGAPGGTRIRVSEERLDEIAEQLRLTPEEIRARFRS